VNIYLSDDSYDFSYILRCFVFYADALKFGT